MKKKYLSLILVAGCCFHGTVYAMEDFSSYAQLRYRYEYDDNFNLKFYGENSKAGKADDGFFLQRVRAGFTYNFSTNILLSVGVQDSRVFGLSLPDELFYSSSLGRPNNPYEDYTEPYNTYLQFQNILESNVNVKIGRQIIKYGDNRIFGPGEWGNSGRYSWDAALISYKKDKNFVDFFWGAHIIHDPEVLSWDHRHQFYGAGAYSHFEFARAFIAEPFLVFKYDDHETFKGESGIGDYFSIFPGMRMTGVLPRDFFYDATYVWQTGEYGSDNVKAWGAHALLGKKFQALPFKPCPSVEYSYATGDEDPTDGVRKRFEGVFGARDKMYGRMNLFDWSNLKDLQFNLDVDPIETLHAKVELHRFWLANAKDSWSLNPMLYRDKTGESGDDVGDEFDLSVTWKPEDLIPKKFGSLEFQGGYSHFWPGGFTEKAADSCEANWYFTQITYNLIF